MADITVEKIMAACAALDENEVVGPFYAFDVLSCGHEVIFSSDGEIHRPDGERRLPVGDCCLAALKAKWNPDANS